MFVMICKDNLQMVVGVYEQWLMILRDIDFKVVIVWVVLDCVCDLGNFGIIICIVDVVGVSGVMLVGDCIDFFVVEIVCVIMGLFFYVMIVKLSKEEFKWFVKIWFGMVVVMYLKGLVDYCVFDYFEFVLFVMGNE